jgi:hypothetical protein
MRAQAASMAGDPFAAMKDLDCRGGDARFDVLAEQLMRHAVVMLADLDVVVETDPAALPLGIFVGQRRQRSERGFARSENTALDAVRVSDLALIPCRPGFFDTAAMSFTANLLKLAGKPGFVVFSQVPARADSVVAEVSEALATYGLTAAPVPVHLRAAYSHAIPGGQSAQEYEPKGKAAGEVAELYRWLNP